MGRLQVPMGVTWGLQESCLILIANKISDLLLKCGAS